MKRRILPTLGSWIGIALFAAALWVLFHALKGYHYQDVTRELVQLPWTRIAGALLLTILSYGVLTGYDTLALRYVRQPLHYQKIAVTSFIGYAFSNNLGFSLLSGGSVRYRLYSAWGLSGFQITQVVAFCSATLWLGFSALAGMLFVLEPLAIPARLHLPFGSIHALGALLLLVPIAYLIATAVRTAPLRLAGWEFDLPRPPVAGLQIALSSTDWVVGGAVLYALLPPSADLGFGTFLSVYLLAQLAGVASQIPAGLGVFESIILLFLAPTLPAASVLGSVLAYRAIYYLLPMGLAAALLGGLEATRRKEGVKRVARLVGQWLPVLAPQVIAFGVFVAGAVLLFSGATPTVHWRVAWLRKLLPLPLVEVSHFINSLVGVGLLLLARGLQRRLDGAYHLTLALLGVGAVVSLLKGFDFEEALTLGLLFLILWPCQHYFYRKTSLITQRYTPGWIAAIFLVLLASLWLGGFSYKYVEYSDELWWRFAFSGDAPRFLRSAVGAFGFLLVFGMARLLRAAPPEPNLPDAADVRAAQSVVAGATATYPNLALLGDKHLLFNDARTAFIMYGVQGKTWVAMGDPVGPRSEWQELIWRFREISNRHDGWTVFYQVAPENLPLYLDLGLTLLKLGEEARVDLARFSLEGSTHKAQRNLINRIDRDGYIFDVIPASGVSGLLPELRQVSDAWLANKHTKEKRFSVGYFDEVYLQHFPVALVRKQHRVVAFANLWPGANREELSIDLMRYRPDAPEGVMEYLFIRLMLHAKQEGYHWFNLGMAPLAGLENRALAPLWNRLGSMVFRHGEHFYNFRGLRQYKMKFDPEWTPKYLASPGGLALPRVLAQIAALISAGIKGVISK
jgi:phosphatidylglycerol lysyltransferase